MGQQSPRGALAPPVSPPHTTSLPPPSTSCPRDAHRAPPLSTHARHNAPAMARCAAGRDPRRRKRSDAPPRLAEERPTPRRTPRPARHGRPRAAAAAAALRNASERTTGPPVGRRKNACLGINGIGHERGSDGNYLLKGNLIPFLPSFCGERIIRRSIGLQRHRRQKLIRCREERLFRKNEGPRQFRDPRLGQWRRPR